MKKISNIQRRLNGLPTIPASKPPSYKWGVRESSSGFGGIPEPKEVVHKDPKGLLGGRCNVTACQDIPARYFNTGMNAYYCRACAQEIDRFNPPSDGFKLFKDLRREMQIWNLVDEGEAPDYESAKAMMGTF